MSSRYGIVYMGSKENILNLIDYIMQREYKKKYFIDLFTGGFSVSGYVLKKSKFFVIANDLNKYVIDLYHEILLGSKELDKVKYDWVSRDLFYDVKNYPENYPNWYVGYIMQVWSFGCNQNDYLYGKDLEEDKHALHQAIVFNDFSLIDKNPLFKGLLIPDNIKTMDYKKHSETKRTAFMRHIKVFISQNKHNLQLQRLKMIINLNLMEHLNAISQYKRLFGKRFSLLKSDWKKALETIDKNILKQAVIYCDPPYENTKKYKYGDDFGYSQFWDWFRNSEYCIYVSSYSAPEDIKPLNFDFKQVNLDNGSVANGRVAEKKKSIENIYWNGKGDSEPTFLDLLFETEGGEM